MNSSLKKFLLSPIAKVVIAVVFYAVIITLIYLLLNTSADFVVYGIMILCGYFGWKALNKISPSIFLTMPIFGWLIYFFIKGILSILIGVFVAPFVISKMITKAIQRNVANNE